MGATPASLATSCSVTAPLPRLARRGWTASVAIGRCWPCSGPKVSHRTNTPVQTVHADFPHTAYQWSSAHSIVRPCPCEQRLRRVVDRTACRLQVVTPTSLVLHMHAPARCPLGCGPELPLQSSHFVAWLIATGVVRSGHAGHSLALTRSTSMTTAGTLPSSRVMPHGLRRLGSRLGLQYYDPLGLPLRTARLRLGLIRARSPRLGLRRRVSHVPHRSLHACCSPYPAAATSALRFLRR